MGWWNGLAGPRPELFVAFVAADGRNLGAWRLCGENLWQRGVGRRRY